MNFIKEVEAGIEGRYKGLETGLKRFDKFINGIQKKSYYVIGGLQKSGKTAFVDKLFVLGPYENNPSAKVNWIYFSLEVDLVEKMAKYCAYFMDKKYGIYCDSNYILSRGQNQLSKDHFGIVKKIYSNELVDLFGIYDDTGNLIKPGRIMFHQDKINPEGVRQFLMGYAERNGTFLKEPYTINIEGKTETRHKIVGYKENDPSLYTIVILDHVGLLSRERGFNKKETIDKMSSHFVWFRNICNFTPVIASQFNRELSKVDRLKFSGEQLQPSMEDFKDSGSLGEDCTMAVAIFSPTNYPHLERHLKYDLPKIGKSYRSAHILASRNTESNVNIAFLMEGKTGNFKELPKAGDTEHLEKVYEYVKNKNLI